jgi:hypothetical protein
LADAIVTDMATNGTFDVLCSDPGSALTSKAIAMVLEWIGMSHKISLVDRHQSNGCEKPSDAVLQKVRAVCADHRILGQWSSPRVLKKIQFFLNNQVSTETGVSPFEAKFGSFDAEYHRLPTVLPMSELAPKMLKSLNEQLSAIREHMVCHQEKVILKRAKGKKATFQNIYQPGDRVLWNAEERVPKLSGMYKGPFEVVSQDHNDVKCRHLCSHVIKALHVDRLKIFHGTKEEAEELARLDQEQHLVQSITGFVGNPVKRKTCEFEVTFMDGDVLWLSWHPDITSTQAFEKFGNSKPHLRILLMDAKVAAQHISRCCKSPISEVDPGSKCFLDLSMWPYWFYGLEGILDVFHLSYLTPIEYEDWSGRGTTKIAAYLPAFNKHLVMNGYEVHAYGAYVSCPEDVVLVDKAFVKKHPSLLADGGPE